MMRLVAAPALLLAALLASACASQPPNPGYAETVATWDPLPSGQGRVVIYALDAPSVDTDIIVGQNLNPANLECRLGDVEFRLHPDEFAFADLTAGVHALHYQNPLLIERMFGSEGSLELDVATGDVLYVRIGWSGDPQLVSAEVARDELQGLRHKYLRPLPLNL